jgi:hypothetical protein
MAIAIVALTGSAAAQSSHSIFAGVFSTPFHGNPPDEDLWGIRAAAMLGRGLGVEGRWADTSESDYWSVAVIQMLPGARGAKTIQPYGSIGAGRLTRVGEVATFFGIAGGVVTFIGHLGLGVDFRYLHGADRLGHRKVRERHVSFELVWRF